MGEIGPHARLWLDRLHGMGQRLWQMLPVGPTGYGDSPYQSLSTFAGNPAWISFEDLLEDGWLTPGDLYAFPVFDPLRIDFGPVLEARRHVLDTACRRFQKDGRPADRRAFKRFCSAGAGWLDDVALFLALKTEQGGAPWTQWPEPLARRDPDAMASARRRLHAGMDRVRMEQFLFDRQWRRLQRHARRLGVSLFGDLPIYVAQDSADVWAHPELFRLGPDGRPTHVAGVPPDYFSETGQRWGNPLYRWDAHAADGYAWWIARMRRTFDLFDEVRLDHFRGLEKYWEIPAADPTARNGRWVEGPGRPFLEALRDACGGLPLVAEDLGMITREVTELREAFGLPGMTILQFLFGDDATARHAASLCGPGTVVYTGTHDNNTAAGWFHSPPGTDNTHTAHQTLAERKRALHVLRSDGREIHWDLIGFALHSRAPTAVAPLQDLLGLSAEARMNTPGRPEGNWRWRFTWEQLSGPIQARMLELTAATGRTHPPRARRSRP
jgi:4-alpha-glucanotransferase